MEKNLFDNMWDTVSKNINFDSVDRPLDNTVVSGNYYTCDGKRVATMEEVYAYNKLFYESMLNKIENNQITNDVDDIKMHR